MKWGKVPQMPIFTVPLLNCPNFIHRIITSKNSELKLIISFLYTGTATLLRENISAAPTVYKHCGLD